MLIEEEDEDGELVYQRRYVCDRNETMAEAGAEPNAKFVVEVVEENDEDDEKGGWWWGGGGETGGGSASQI